METRTTIVTNCCWGGHQGVGKGLTTLGRQGIITLCTDDVSKWKHFPRYWPFVWGIHRSPVNSPHKGQWRRAFMFSLICAWINAWVNNREAGDLRRHRAHYDVIVICFWIYDDSLQTAPPDNRVCHYVMYINKTKSRILTFRVLWPA